MLEAEIIDGFLASSVLQEYTETKDRIYLYFLGYLVLKRFSLTEDVSCWSPLVNYVALSIVFMSTFAKDFLSLSLSSLFSNVLFVLLLNPKSFDGENSTNIMSTI